MLVVKHHRHDERKEVCISAVGIADYHGATGVGQLEYHLRGGVGCKQVEKKRALETDGKRLVVVVGARDGFFGGLAELDVAARYTHLTGTAHVGGQTELHECGPLLPMVRERFKAWTRVLLSTSTRIWLLFGIIGVR